MGTFFQKRPIGTLMSPLGYRKNHIMCDYFVINGTQISYYTNKTEK